MQKSYLPVAKVVSLIWTQYMPNTADIIEKKKTQNQKNTPPHQNKTAFVFRKAGKENIVIYKRFVSK